MTKIVERLHARQVLQTIKFDGRLTLCNSNTGPNNIQQTGNIYYALDDPTVYNGLGFASTTQFQIYPERINLHVYATNNVSNPVRLEVIKFITRKNVPSTLDPSLTIELETGTNTSHYPYSSITTGLQLQKLYKIMKTKRIWLQPGATKIFTLKRKKWSTPLYSEVDFNQTQWDFVKGNQWMLIRVMGQPVPWNIATNPWNGMALSPYDVSFMQTRYLSYTNMEEFTFQTSMLSNLYFTFPSAPPNQIFPGKPSIYLGCAAVANPISTAVTENTEDMVIVDKDKDHHEGCNVTHIGYDVTSVGFAKTN